MVESKKSRTQIERELAALREHVSAVDRQYQAVSRVVSILNTDLSIEESVREVGAVLQDLIPCDRFTLVLALINRGYHIQNHRLDSRSMNYRVQAPDYNASRWVLHNKRPLLRRDISREQRFERDVIRIEEGMLSDLIVPLVVDEEVVGTFNFTARGTHRFNENHLETAQEVADAIAVMFKQLQMRQELEAVREIFAGIGGMQDVNTILETILAHIQDQNCDRVRIYLYDEQEDAMVRILQVGLDEDARVPVAFPVQDDIYTKRTLSSNHPRIYQTGDPEGEAQRCRREEAGIPRIFDSDTQGEWGEIPMKVVEGDREVIVGKMSLDNALSRRPLVQARLERLMVYVSGATIAVRHAQLHEQMAKQVAAELEKAEEVLRETERLRVLAETAGATAHEINQPLQVILGNAQILQLELGPDSSQFQSLSDIIESGKRVSEIVKKMQSVRQYTTKSYTQGTKIVDFDRSSEGGP